MIDSVRSLGAFSGFGKTPRPAESAALFRIAADALFKRFPAALAK
jgi:hypothetical protein